MANQTEITPLPDNFETLETFWAFWDEHSSADYESLMEPIEASINLASSKVYYAIDKDLLETLRTLARKRGVSTETLINLWLHEKASAV